MSGLARRIWNGWESCFWERAGSLTTSGQPRAQTARIYRTEVVREPGTVTAAGDEYCWLKAWAYLMRTEKNQELITEIEGGIKKEVSVGCSMGRSVCSVCGAENGACGHVKGQMYGEKLCFMELKDPKDAYEWSFVAVPAQPRAGVVKRFGSEGTELRTLRKQAELGQRYLTGCAGRWCVLLCWRTGIWMEKSSPMPLGDWMRRNCWS